MSFIKSNIEWCGVSRLYITPTWHGGGECSIYGNGLNRIRVTVRVIPIDQDRTPIPSSVLSDDEIKKQIKFIDFTNDAELTKNPEFFNKYGAVLADGWYYSETSNEFDAIPEKFTVRSKSDMVDSLDKTDGLRIFDFFIYCKGPGGRSKRIAMLISPSHGAVIKTSQSNPAMASHVDFKSKTPLVYDATDCRHFVSEWIELEHFGESGELANTDFHGRIVSISPKNTGMHFIKSINESAEKTSAEIKSLKAVDYRDDLEWLARYAFVRPLVYTYYAWDINGEAEGDVYGEGIHKYKLLGRRQWGFYVKVPIPIGIEEHRRVGSFRVAITRQSHWGGEIRHKSFDARFAVFDQYGNMGRFKLRMSEDDFPEGASATFIG